MHLKSLVLKGFKSFADRSVLSMEPGITAIVGPNGSGKSNISDAVLWVLGERNARNLRGQAMEDVIFSGSAARKAVSVAEVELVLDNADHTLPVDFDEVSIARRMYRTGESEYLVNGAVVRRMDVLDILHDSGLGTGTHSIISQGSLDSILQSSPADRRALIEEAAGVLKHKQRKEKSARKLEKMENHLARVRDVAAEVARQLGPLERKAKRAQAYQEASAELAELRLALAVDDLRRLQGEWERAKAAEEALAGEVEARRADADAAEQRVADLQEAARRSSEDAGELARRQRRAAAVAERLDGVDMLVRERRRNGQGLEADVLLNIEAAQARKEQALAEQARAAAQLEEVQGACAQADAQVERLSTERAQAAAERRAVEEQLELLASQSRSLEREAEVRRAKLAELKERLAGGEAQGRLVEARRTEIAAELERARADHEAQSAAYSQARERLAALEDADRTARAASASAFTARDEQRAARDAAHEEERLLRAEVKAIQQAQRAAREEDPALVWLLDHADEFGAGLAPVARALRAPLELELLVERLLAEDLAALSVVDMPAALSVARALQEGALPGDVVLVSATGTPREGIDAACEVASGTPLVHLLEYPQAFAQVVEALLGDVVVCASRDSAFEAQAADAAGLRFVSPDGCIVGPRGKVRVLGAPAHGDGEGRDDGVLARERRLAQASAQLEVAEAALGQAESRAARAEEEHRLAQEASLAASQELARQKGAVQAAEAEFERTKRRLEAVARDAEDMDRKRQEAQASLAELRPAVEAAQDEIAQLEERRRAVQEEHAACQESLAPLRKRAGALSEQLNEARLSAATLAERKMYAERTVAARGADAEAAEASARDARESLHAKRAAVARTAPLLDVLEKLAAGLRRRTIAVDAAIERQEGAAGNVHAQAAQARDAARTARDGFDEATARMSQARVEKGRLEVQVEAALSAVTRDCATPLDRAQELPQLADRAAAEEAAFKLERRIKNMGVINPDAAEQYAELKERYDYLAGQLADMDAARRSLAKIVRIVDARMKDDFANTFAEVSANFSEIFSVLFPGGQAQLVLEDPDDLENTGVEVTAQPRGKRITKMMLMSGGEKSLTALALLFAVYRTRATPFYILDEVEAALDDSNLRRLMAFVDDLRATTQLIMITHQRRTMEMADVLFGVSMQADGVTKVVSQKLDRALEHAE